MSMAEKCNRLLLDVAELVAQAVPVDGAGADCEEYLVPARGLVRVMVGLKGLTEVECTCAACTAAITMGVVQ